MKAVPTYTARWEATGVSIYERQPKGNLVGELPIGARFAEDAGTLPRKDGGDPFERARFIVPSLRTILITRDGSECPDGGTCHHKCAADGDCWRADNCAPLSSYGPTWQKNERETT